MGSLAWGGELDLRTDPGSLPSPSLWASGGEGAGRPPWACGSQWAGDGVGSLVILSPSDTWPCLEAFYWEWGCYWGLGGKATGAAHLPSGHRTEPTTKAVLAPDVRTLP